MQGSVGWVEIGGIWSGRGERKGVARGKGTGLEGDGGDEDMESGERKKGEGAVTWWCRVICYDVADLCKLVCTAVLLYTQQ